MFDWTEAMLRRHSVRRYTQEAVAEDDLTALRRAIAEADPLDQAVPVRVELAPFGAIGSRSSVGAIGPMSPAPWYLVATAAPHPGRMEEVGFRMEQVILAATSLGLGTCWIGGGYRRDDIAAGLGIAADDVIAISPVGHGDKGRVAALTRGIVKSMAAAGGKRKPLGEFVFEANWGRAALPASVSPEVWEALEMARLAPSWSNTQPWFFLTLADCIWAFADTRPQRGNARPGKPYYRLDAGIAMAHFHLAMRRWDNGGRWQELEGATNGDAVLDEAGVPAHAQAMARYPLL